MDQSAIFVDDLPKNLMYGQIKAAFWPYQPSPPVLILKKEKYLIITFASTEIMERVLSDKANIRIQGKPVSIKQAFKQFVPHYIHIPPSFHLPPSSLFPLPPPIVLTPPFLIPAPVPPPPVPTPPTPPAYEHPFPDGFSFFYYK